MLIVAGAQRASVLALGITFPGGSDGKEFSCNSLASHTSILACTHSFLYLWVQLFIIYGFNHWVGKIPWRSDGNSLQYSCLGNPTDREPGGLQSMGFQRVGHDWAISTSPFTFFLRKQHLCCVLKGE